MKLLQLNAWSARLDGRIRRLLETEQAQFVTLQEMIQSNFDNGFFVGIDEIAERTGYENKYFSPVYDFRFMRSKLEFGNAIMSSLPFDEKDTVFTNLEFTTDFSFEDHDYNIRNFQHVRICLESGANLHLINHHGYHINAHKNGNDITLRACQQIVDYAKRLDGPVIIAGDFNLIPESESIREISRNFRNLTEEYGLSTTRTTLTSKTEPCDFIFVSDEVLVNDFYVSDIEASDHVGLILDFDVSAS